METSLQFGTLGHQQQVTTFDGAPKFLDRDRVTTVDLVTTVTASNVGQQTLPDVGGSRFPALVG